MENDIGFEEFYDSGFLRRLADALAAVEWEDYGKLPSLLADKPMAYTMAVYDRLDGLDRSYEGLDPDQFTDYDDGYADACLAMELNNE